MNVSKEREEEEEEEKGGLHGEEWDLGLKRGRIETVVKLREGTCSR